MLRFLVISILVTSSMGFGSRSLRLLRSSYCRNGVASTASMSTAEDGIWSREIVPRDYNAVEELMNQSLEEYFLFMNADDNGRVGGKRLSIDLLTPGLNPKLEQKALLMQDFLFDVLISSFPVIDRHFENVKLAFSSAGDAAGFQKHLMINRMELPDTMTLTDVGLRNMNTAMDCVVFVQSRNYRGDPVINTIQEICEKYPHATYLFLNCDLSDQVALGLQERARKDAFRRSIKPVFYFRNLVRTLRPSLVPIELGCLMYTPMAQKWSVSIVNDADIPGPGSLNRYMKVAMFQRDPEDPTRENPPRFLQAGQFRARPNRQELDQIISRADFLNAKYERDQKQQEKNKIENLKKYGDLSLFTLKEARRIVQDLATGAAAGAPDDVLLFRALKLLKRNYRETRTLQRQQQQQQTKAAAGEQQVKQSSVDPGSVAAMFDTNTSSNTADQKSTDGSNMASEPNIDANTNNSNRRMTMLDIFDDDDDNGNDIDATGVTGQEMKRMKQQKEKTPSSTATPSSRSPTFTTQLDTITDKGRQSTYLPSAELVLLTQQLRVAFSNSNTGKGVNDQDKKDKKDAEASPPLSSMKFKQLVELFVKDESMTPLEAVGNNNLDSRYPSFGTQITWEFVAKSESLAPNDNVPSLIMAIEQNQSLFGVSMMRLAVDGEEFAEKENIVAILDVGDSGGGGSRGAAGAQVVVFRARIDLFNVKYSVWVSM